MAMTSPETQISRLLLKMANLLNSVAEAAWRNDLPSPARWDLHRIGTKAYLAHREILDALGQGAAQTEPLPGDDIAAALEEAAHALAAIPRGLHNLDIERLEARVSSLARWVAALIPVRVGQDSDRRSVVSIDSPACLRGESTSAAMADVPQY